MSTSYWHWQSYLAKLNLEMSRNRLQKLEEQLEKEMQELQRNRALLRDHLPTPEESRHAKQALEEVRNEMSRLWE